MIRFATIGTSHITERFLEAAAQCPQLQYAAVCSRSMEKAGRFAERYGAETCHDSLEALAQDGSVDMVYIASPNALHCAQAVRLLRAGKHVLCEKPLASNTGEAEEMFRAARENGTVLLEAMRPVFDPGYECIRDNLHRLGRIRGAQFWYGKYSSKYDAFLAGEHQNIFDARYSAGALMDMGVYCIHPLVGLFGVPEKLHSSCVRLRGGIDGAGMVLAEYDGMTAEVSYSKITNSRLHSEIQGEEGFMVISDISSPREVSCFYNDGRTEQFQIEPCRDNMIFEVRKMVQAIQEGADVGQYHEISRRAMAVLDRIRAQLGIRFPADSSGLPG